MEGEYVLMEDAQDCHEKIESINDETMHSSI